MFCILMTASPQHRRFRIPPGRGDNMRRLLTVATCLCVVLNPVNVPAWDAGPKECKHDECSGKDWRGNTHLFVVNRALDLLAKSDDPIARKAVARMNNKGPNACR